MKYVSATEIGKKWTLKDSICILFFQKKFSTRRLIAQKKKLTFVNFFSVAGTGFEPATPRV